MGRPGSPMWHASTSPEMIVAHYRDVCLSYGHAEGSAALAQCIGQERRTGRARAADAFDDMADNAAAMNPPPSPPRTTTCHRIGNTLNCTEF